MWEFNVQERMNTVLRSNEVFVCLKIQVFVEDERKMKESMCSINCFPDISLGFYLIISF